MHLPAGLLAGFRQSLQKILLVDIVQEDIFPPVTPAQDMIDGTWILDSNLAGMDAFFSNPKVQVQHNWTFLWADPFNYKIFNLFQQTTFVCFF
jgi:hypothetical protein